MTYAKPEVAILGDARVLIETILFGKFALAIDAARPSATPAYDLDE